MTLAASDLPAYLPRIFMDFQGEPDDQKRAASEAANWSRANSDVLVDAHWVGGDPDRGVYGWASWNRRKGILVLRNPDDAPRQIDIDIARAFELPAGAVQKFRLKSPWREDHDKPAIDLVAGQPHRFTIRPFEVLVLDASPQP